jgi:hypothetical protein
MMRGETIAIEVSDDLTIEVTREPCGRRSITLDDGDDKTYLFPRDMAKVAAILVSALDCVCTNQSYNRTGNKKSIIELLPALDCECPEGEDALKTPLPDDDNDEYYLDGWPC